MYFHINSRNSRPTITDLNNLFSIQFFVDSLTIIIKNGVIDQISFFKFILIIQIIVDSVKL